MSPRRLRSTVLALLAWGSAAQCARIARHVRLGTTKRYDLPARKSIQSHKDARLDVLSTALTAATAPAAVVPITLAIAFALRKRGIAAWLPVALSPLAAMTAGALFTKFLPQQYSPDGSGESSFPSGHTTGVTAEVLATSYVLMREGVLRRDAAVLMCALPIVAGVNRLYRDRHWASDILAAWAAGITVAAMCAITYEQLP